MVADKRLLPLAEVTRGYGDLCSPVTPHTPSSPAAARRGRWRLRGRCSAQQLQPSCSDEHLVRRRWKLLLAERLEVAAAAGHLLAQRAPEFRRLTAVMLQLLAR